MAGCDDRSQAKDQEESKEQVGLFHSTLIPVGLGGLIVFEWYLHR